MNFVKTQDASVAQQLRDAGFQELNTEGSFFVFMNNGRMNFSDNKKVIYTNKLSI